MKTKVRRIQGIMALLLSFVMVIGMIPITVSAADGASIFGEKKSGTKSDYYALESKTYDLTEDTYISGYLDVPSGVTATINLNGYTLKRTDTTDSSPSPFGQVIRVKGTLTINGDNGIITGGYGVTDSNGENGMGAGIGVFNGTLNMYKTTITDCHTVDTPGGAISSANGEKMTAYLEDCTITNCSSGYASGAINMGNTEDKVTLVNCTITGNHDTESGGAIDNCGQLILKGKTRIYGNTSTNGNLSDDIMMGGGGTIDASGLTNGSYIGLNYSSNEDRTDLDANGGRVIDNLGSDTSRVALYFFSNDDKYGKKIVDATLELRRHTHSWKYTASGNVLTATCQENNPAGVMCTAEKVQNLTVDATACNKNADGSACSAATVTPSTNWSLTKQSVPTVTYKGVDVSYNSTTPPTNAGTYEATITVGGATAKDSFTIGKLVQNATVSTDNYLYGTTVSTPKLSGAKENPSVTYYYNTENSKEGGKPWSSLTATTLEPGNYYVYAKLSETTNYAEYTTEPSSFTVYGQDFGVITADEVVVTYDGNEHGITVVGAPEDAKIEYKVGDGEYSETNPTFTNASSHNVYYRVTKTGYNTIKGNANVTILKKQLTDDMIADIASVTYNGNEQSKRKVVGV